MKATITEQQWNALAVDLQQAWLDEQGPTVALLRHHAEIFRPEAEEELSPPPRRARVIATPTREGQDYRPTTATCDTWEEARTLAAALLADGYSVRLQWEK